MNGFRKNIKFVVCALILLGYIMVAPAIGDAGDVYQSFYQYSQTFYYCSATSCTGGTSGICSGSQYSCPYTATTFKNQFDLSEPRIFCHTDAACTLPSTISYSISLNGMATPHLLRIYIPSGTKWLYIATYGMAPYGLIAAVSQFGTPPTSNGPQKYTDFSVTSGDPYYVNIGGSSLAQLRSGQQFTVNEGGTVIIVKNSSVPLVTTGGWLYVKLLPYDGSEATDCQIYSEFDKTTFSTWYNSAQWDASGDPVAATSPLTISPASLAFGNVTVNTPSIQKVTLTNSGTTSLTVSSLLASNAAFGVDWSQGTIPASSNQAVNVTFTPPAAQSYAATLTAISSAGNATASLTGTGIASTKQLTVSPAALNFATTWNGESSPLPLTLSSTGSSNITVSSISSDNNIFVVGDWKSGTIPGASNQTVWITFKPSENRRYYGTVTIKSDNPGGDITVSVSGVGIGPKAAIVKGNFSDILKLADVALKPDKSYTSIKFLNAAGNASSSAALDTFNAMGGETVSLGRNSEFDLAVGQFADTDDNDRVLKVMSDTNGNVQDVVIYNIDGSYTPVALSDGGFTNVSGIRAAAGAFSGESSRRSDFVIAGIGSDGNYQIKFYKYTGQLINKFSGTLPCQNLSIAVGSFYPGDNDVVIAMQNKAGTLTTLIQRIDGTIIGGFNKTGSGTGTDAILMSDVDVAVLPANPAVNPGGDGYAVSGRISGGTSDGKLTLISFDSSSNMLRNTNGAACSDVHLTSVNSTTYYGYAVSYMNSSSMPSVVVYGQDGTQKGAWTGTAPALTTDVVGPDDNYGISLPVLMYLDSAGSQTVLATPLQ